MSASLRDLLEKMREHPAFPELLKAVPVPEPQDFKPYSKDDPQQQTASWIHRSGRAHQQRAWLDFLQHTIPPSGG